MIFDIRRFCLWIRIVPSTLEQDNITFRAAQHQNHRTYSKLDIPCDILYYVTIDLRGVVGCCPYVVHCEIPFRDAYFP